MHGSGTHVDTGYYFSEWKEADGQCECGHPSTSQITPGGWSVTPSLSIPIAFLEITFGYTDDPPDPVSISCVPGTCSRNKALYYTMTTDRLIHWKGTKLVQCATGGTFSQCYAEWDIHCKSQDISSGYQLTWAYCGYKPSQAPCQKAPCTEHQHDKNGNEIGKDLNPCPHVGTDKKGRKVNCPYPYWTKKPKKKDDIPLDPCTEPFHGTSSYCCD